jgi:acyl dehydratase
LADADSAAFYAKFSERGVVDEAALAEARALVGVPLRVEQWNTAATIDNIRHYALALGDLNPLWHDVEYGQRSVHGTLVAPPTFFYAIYQGLAPGLGGLSALNLVCTWRFSDWARLGDTIEAEAYVLDVQLAEGTKGRKRLDQQGRIDYWRVEADGSKTKLAELDITNARIPARGEGGLDYAPRAAHVYTSAELEEIEAAVLAVRQRGTQRRSWESVSVGDYVDRVIKGPYTQMSMVCYYASAPGSPGYRAFDAWWRNHQRAIDDPESLPNTFDSSYFRGTGTSSMGHHDVRASQSIGMPGVYDNGNQRVGVMATALTNWMGDEGFLSEYSHRLRRPVILGDTIYIDGEVVGKEGGRVDVRLRALNQLGELVSTGEASILLPSESD